MDFFRICLMFFQRGLYMITKLNNRELFQFCEQFSIILRSGMSAIEGTQQRADILGKMDATTAAKLTEIMEPSKKK